MDEHRLKGDGTLSTSLFWAVLERFGYTAVSFVFSVILARLLSPDDYGKLSIMLVFTNISATTVQAGLSSALIQNKDITDNDFSTALWINLLMASAFYAAIFLGAPAISRFYELPDLVLPLRILGLILFPDSIQSVQQNRLRRVMNFRMLFYLSFLSTIIGGVCGTVAALAGLGIWALILHLLSFSVSGCVILWIFQRWIPNPGIEWGRAARMFSYSSKMLGTSIIFSIYSEITSLVIGKKYTSTALAYYEKGRTLPTKIRGFVESPLNSVMFPMLSREQDHRERYQELARQAIRLGCYVMFPVMAGLAGTAEPLVTLLFTEKWLPCAVFLQLECVDCAFRPILNLNAQAVTAAGRSDLYLKAQIVECVAGLAALIVSVACFHSVLAIVWSRVLMIPVNLLILTIANRSYLEYSFFSQIRDCLPYGALSVGMFLAVQALGRMTALPTPAVLAVQVAAGVAIYVAASVIFRLEEFQLCCKFLLRRR